MQYSSHPVTTQIKPVRRNSRNGPDTEGGGSQSGRTLHHRPSSRLGNTGLPPSSSQGTGLPYPAVTAAALERQAMAMAKAPEKFDISSLSDRTRTSRSNQAKAHQLALELEIKEQMLLAEHHAQLLKLRLERQQNLANMEGSQGSRMSFEQSGSIQRFFNSVDSLHDGPDLDYFEVVGDPAPARACGVGDGRPSTAPLALAPGDPCPMDVDQRLAVHAGVPAAPQSAPVVRGAALESLARRPMREPAPAGANSPPGGGNAATSFHLTENHAHDNREIHMNVVHIDSTLPVDVLREHQNIVDQSNYNTRMQTEAEANVMHKVVTEQMREEHVQQQQALIAALAVQQQEDAAALVAEAERRHSEVISATTQQCGSQIVQVQQACQQFEHEVVTQATEYAEDREAQADCELGEYRKAYESLHYQTEGQNSTVTQLQRDFAALQLQLRNEEAACHEANQQAELALRQAKHVELNAASATEVSSPSETGGRQGLEGILKKPGCSASFNNTVEQVTLIDRSANDGDSCEPTTRGRRTSRGILPRDRRSLTPVRASSQRRTRLVRDGTGDHHTRTAHTDWETRMNERDELLTQKLEAMFISRSEAAECASPPPQRGCQRRGVSLDQGTAGISSNGSPGPHHPDDSESNADSDNTYRWYPDEGGEEGEER